MEAAPHFKISVSENDPEKCVFQVIEKVRPEWDPAKIKTKLLTDGITNKLVQCKIVSDDGAEEVLLVRIYGNKTDLLIDRKAEIRNIKLLHSYSLAPSLYATFENGLVYEFIPGRTLTTEDVKNPAIYKKVAREMAKMHKVKDPSQDPPKASLWSKLEQFCELVPEKFDDKNKQERYEKLNLSKELLRDEIKKLRNDIGRRMEKNVVFCHNDLLLGNIIYNESEDKVSFIDYEYASYNYQAFDIANHFAEYAGVNDIDYRRFPDWPHQLDWLKTYLMEFKNVPDVEQDEVMRLHTDVAIFVCVAHLFWYTWAMIQAEHSKIDFDFIGYAALRLKEYHKRRPIFFPNGIGD